MRSYSAALLDTGGLVLIHGEIIHRSGPNTTSRSRNIYTWHVMETENVKYSEDNWYARLTRCAAACLSTCLTAALSLSPSPSSYRLQPEPKITLYDA